MKLTRLIAFLVLLVLSGGSALAAPGDCRQIEDAAQVCRLDVWLHKAETAAGNLGATGETAYPSWNTTRPTGNAGGGYAGHWGGDFAVEEYQSGSTATFEGSFKGNLDNAAVTLYLFAPGYSAQGLPGYHLRTQIVVSGRQLYTSDFTNGDVVKITKAGEAVFKIEYALVNLYPGLKASGQAGDANPHQIRLSVTPYLAGDEAMFVYDSAEVPSGIVFNLEPSGLGAYTQLRAP